jgi:hypothetical protein
MPGEGPASAKQGDLQDGKAKKGKDGPSELLDYVVAYAKQETLDPIVRQAKSLGKGIAGAFLLAIGTVLLAIGFLRALQAQFGSTSGTPTVAQISLSGPASVPKIVVRSAAANPYGSGHPLSGDWSWVPYMAGALLCVLVAVFCVTRIMKGTSK